MRPPSGRIRALDRSLFCTQGVAHRPETGWCSLGPTSSKNTEHRALWQHPIFSPSRLPSAQEAACRSTCRHTHSHTHVRAHTYITDTHVHARAHTRMHRKCGTQVPHRRSWDI